MSEIDMNELRQLQAEVAASRAEMADLRSDIKGLVEAWRTAQGVVRFVKWLSSVAAAVAVLWALIKLVFGVKV